REDRRHIKDRDLELIREVIHTRLNMEMAATQAMIEKALMVKPDICTIVPEKREERTTESGLDVITYSTKLKEAIETLSSSGIQVSLFVDPELAQIRESAKLGAYAVEIHTGSYADASDPQERDMLFEDVANAAVAANKLGMFVAAGHGLNYQNVADIAAISEIQELNIGHSIIARSAFVGLTKAIEDMRYLIDR
ncbi:pyridoxine 5'-phosphate synthase, partial [bacterium]|nr:pyridoxine 5'-phosphate synthase [bacterium]